MKGQVDSYSMLICSKYVSNIKDMINITLVNPKFKDNIDKLHFNPFQINKKTRRYFNNLQTQWLFGEDDELFSDGDISAYYVFYEVNYKKYLEMLWNKQNIKFRRITYTNDDRKKYGDEIPNVVNKLDGELFYKSTFEKINIPNSIVEINYGCFHTCGSLTSITLSSRLTNIGEDLFSDCTKLSSITLPSVLTSLNNGMFCGCTNLKTIEYSPFVVNLNDGLFYGSKGLSTLSIPASITRIGGNCFAQCILTTLTIPSNVIQFGTYSFSYNKELKEVELPINMKEIVSGMFYECPKLTKINIPMSVSSIGNSAFKGCSQLRSVSGNVDVCKKFNSCFEHTPILAQN